MAEIDIDSDAPAAFGDGDRDFLERVAELLSPYCLVGWDTGGERLGALKHGAATTAQAASRTSAGAFSQ